MLSILHCIRTRYPLPRLPLPSALALALSQLYFPPPTGFIIPQDVPAHSWLKRRIAPPTNRYHIKVGVKGVRRGG